MAESVGETIGGWVNDGRDWVSERLTIGDWIEDGEDWLNENASIIFDWTDEKLTWLVDTLQSALGTGEPPLLALFMAGLAIWFTLRALGSPVSMVNVALIGLVAVPVVLWAHDADAQWGLAAALVAMLAVIVLYHNEALNPYVLGFVMFGPVAAIVLRGNRLLDDPPDVIWVLTALAVLLVAVLVVLAVRQQAPSHEVVVGVATTVAVVAGVLTEDTVVAAVAVVGAVVAVGATALSGQVSRLPLDGFALALLAVMAFLWGNPGQMAALFGVVMAALVLALALIRPTGVAAGRPLVPAKVLRGLAYSVGLVVAFALVAYGCRLFLDHVATVQLLRPIAATTDVWVNWSFVAAAGAVVLLVLVALGATFVLSRGAGHAAGLALTAGGAFMLDDPLFMALVLGVLAWELRSFTFGVTSAVGLAVIDMMDLWSEAMQTLSLVLVASLLAVSIGLPIGVLVTRSTIASRVVRPVLDFMQTMPAFVYLIPAVTFFSLGAVPGAVATIIFSMPPAVRLTELGIRQVDREVVEAGEAFGTPPRSILTRIQIPLAMPTIMAGVNQVIMLALSMVVIAGLVGAAGLGTEVVRGISRQDTGVGFQAGLAVVILAIFLDRLTAALGQGDGNRSDGAADEESAADDDPDPGPDPDEDEAAVHRARGVAAPVAASTGGQ